MITIPREICIDLDRAIRKEWVVCNGIGGFASSSITGINTRRYHGLLVAALKPPVNRTMLLVNIDEEVQLDERTYYLGANEYPGHLHPGGFVHIERFFIKDGIPTTVFQVGGAVIHKTIWMEHGYNTTYVRYAYLEGEEECCLVLHPMCAYRDYHAITRGALDWSFGVEPLQDEGREGGCKVTAHADAQPYWLLTDPVAEFTPTGVWYWNFVHRCEMERGYDEREDLYVPGVIRAVLQPGDSLTLVASTEPPEASRPLLAEALERERSRQRALLTVAGMDPQIDEEDAADPNAPMSAFTAQLVLTADTFMATRQVEEDGDAQPMPTVLAGYHWFTDWGRDTMISLPGLTLVTGRTEQAEQIVRLFTRLARRGLIPNNFADTGGEAHYNTVDATLWMFHAVEKLWEATGDVGVARDLFPALSEIVAGHVRGTDYGIRMDPGDGLLCTGEEGVQLTWMDAKIDGWVVTPRTGKPVEINALWYNALRVMGTLQEALGLQSEAGEPRFKELAAKAKRSFRARFWHEPGGYLFDVVDGPGGDDASIRPNQVLALALSGGELLPKDKARRTLAVVREHVFTPYGLRTLSPHDPKYKKLYAGDRRERDAAYHNGTVWTWLLGPYFDAVSNIEGKKAVQQELAAILPHLRSHLADAGLGSISEVFDADPPHGPKGCVSQAWSVAEVLRHVKAETRRSAMRD